MTGNMKAFYIIGFKSETVEGAVILNSFQSNGTGRRALNEAKMKHFNDYVAIRLVREISFKK